ncbi:MAG: hypothetical protein E6R04_04945 [Spirochaetes bacterium]|jgi:hypothetical protein|nr:MAG: hypothetical protein E6R04_04945 [Spirochaetota bacterium]
MGIDLREPISREEMERFAEDTMALWRTQYMLFLKAQAQGAPQGLIVEMADVSELFRQTHERLKNLVQFFPSENDS